MEEVLFSCQACGVRLWADKHDMGSEVSCPSCNAAIKIPKTVLQTHCVRCKTPLLVTGANLIEGATCSQCESVPSLQPVPPSQPKEDAKVCPSCGTQLPPEFVICVNCGLNFQTGEMLRTSINAPPPDPISGSGENRSGTRPKIGLKKNTIADSATAEEGAPQSEQRREGREKGGGWQKCLLLLDRLWTIGKVTAGLLVLIFIVFIVWKSLENNLSSKKGLVSQVERTPTLPEEKPILPEEKPPEKQESEVPFYPPRLSNNAFDSIMLYCQKHRLSLSIDPDIVQVLGKIPVDLPDGPSDPLQALSKSVATRGFVIHQVPLNQKVKVAFLTTPDCWAYLNAIQWLWQGKAGEAQRWLQSVSTAGSTEFSQHCVELQRVLDAILVNNREMDRLQADVNRGIETYRLAENGMAVAKTAAASAMNRNRGVIQSQLAMAQARKEEALRGANAAYATLLEFIRGENLKNRSIFNRWITAFDQSLCAESQFLLGDLFLSYSKLKTMVGIFEHAGISLSAPKSTDAELGNPPEELLRIRDYAGKVLLKAAQYSSSGITAMDVDRLEAARNFSRSHIIDRSSLTARLGYGYCLRDAYVQALGYIDGTTRFAPGELEASICAREEAEKLRVFYEATKRPPRTLASSGFAPVGHARGLSVNGIFSEGALLSVSVQIIPLEKKTVTVGTRERNAVVIGNQRGFFGAFNETTRIIQAEVKDAAIHINAIEYGDEVDPLMRISAYEAFKWLRTIDSSLGDTRAIDITLHNLGGPKGGDSAGVTFATCGYSAIQSIPVKPSVAMTGSVRADGAVKAVGGVTQKIVGALQANGVEVVIVPKENEPDLLFVPVDQLLRLTLIVTDRMDTYLNYAMDWPSKDLTKLDTYLNYAKSWLSKDMIKQRAEAQETLRTVQLAQVLLSLGDRTAAMSLLQPVAAKHPEVYTARRLLELLKKSNGQKITSDTPVLTENKSTDTLMAQPRK